MKIKTILTSTIILLSSITLSAAPFAEVDSLRHAFGRESVNSSKNTGTPYADTLDTGNPGVKVVLYSNGTWAYKRDPAVLAKEKVFNEYWDTNVTNPYRDDTKAPEDLHLWIVDTLDSYCCPNKTTPSSKYGYRHGRRHTGIDLPYPKGTPVYATFDGKVRLSDYVGGYGNLVIIRHANGLETFYGHLSERKVTPGQWVQAGEVIGLGGSTGRSTGPHLHFETRYRGYSIDPSWLIDFETGALRHRMLHIRGWYFNPSQRYVQSVDDEDAIWEGDEKARIEAEEKAKKLAQERERAAQAAIKYHTVRSGDTLSKIAVKYHTTVRNICRLNGIKETTTLQIGRKLRVR